MANLNHIRILFEKLDVELIEGKSLQRQLKTIITSTRSWRRHTLNSKFQGIKLRGLDFSNIDLSHIYLRNAKLQGTSFRESNLVSSDLPNANCIKTDFYHANLTRANFTGANLREANLCLANCHHANFIETDLNKANLIEAQLNFSDFEGSDLSHAHLMRANVLETSFKNSTLTGACIEDWHTNSNTHFEDVICDYIYLKWDHQNNCPADRRPSNPNRNFALGEFTKLFYRVRETVDLIFSEGIDWQAFLESYQNIQCESEHGELDICAIEKSSDGSFVIRVEVPKDIDKANLESQFYGRYEAERKQFESYYQQQLKAKENEIEIYREQNANIFELAKLAANKPIIVNNEAKAVTGDHIHQSGNFGIGVNQGEVQKDAIVAGFYDEAPKQDLQAAAEEIQALLKQLSEQYGDDEDLLAAKIVKTAKKTDSNLHKLLLSLQAGSVSAIDSFLDHPAASFVIGFLDTWHQNELKK